MIIFGFGNDPKRLADAGMLRCRNCKNLSFFSLMETARKFTLYFVKVARYEKKYYAVCDTCTAAYELDDKGKDDILRHSVALPSRDVYCQLWGHLDQALSAIVARGLEMGPYFTRAKEALYASYSPQHVELVAYEYVRSLSDGAPPR